MSAIQPRRRKYLHHETGEPTGEWNGAYNMRLLTEIKRF
jgi:hypothetical protein